MRAAGVGVSNTIFSLKWIKEQVHKTKTHPGFSLGRKQYRAHVFYFRSIQEIRRYEQRYRIHDENNNDDKSYIHPHVHCDMWVPQRVSKRPGLFHTDGKQTHAGQLYYSSRRAAGFVARCLLACLLFSRSASSGSKQRPNRASIRGLRGLPFPHPQRGKTPRGDN